MDRGESSDDVDGSGAFSKKMEETDNGQAYSWSGREVNRCSVFSILARYPCKKFLRLETLLSLFLTTMTLSVKEI